MIRERVGFIGCGNMASALIGGLLKSKTLNSRDIYAFDIRKERLKKMENEHGINALRDNTDVVRKSDIIVLAVKPQNIKEVLEEIKSSLSKDKRLFSIAAGISTRFIEETITEQIPVVRVMPNTGALVGLAASGICKGRYTDEDGLKLAREIFGAVGVVITVDDEDLIDVVTAISGSGPAYVFYLVEAFIQAGLSLGLSREVSNLLANQTIVGAGHLLSESGSSPEGLRRAVTSPGGTTEAAIALFEKKEFKNIVVEAIKAAYTRARELSK